MRRRGQERDDFSLSDNFRLVTFDDPFQNAAEGLSKLCDIDPFHTYKGVTHALAIIVVTGGQNLLPHGVFQAFQELVVDAAETAVAEDAHDIAALGAFGHVVHDGVGVGQVGGVLAFVL
jgi:hypothetical protein